jgi:hypothetical protein
VTRFSIATSIRLNADEASSRVLVRVPELRDRILLQTEQSVRFSVRALRPPVSTMFDLHELGRANREPTTAAVYASSSEKTKFRDSYKTRTEVNIRHAAALAHVGWYLMVPVIKHGQVQTPRLAEWRHLASYDSAKECETNGLFVEKSAEKTRDHDLIAGVTSFQCIASDDPRLKEK